MESMVAKLQELIDRKPEALSIFLVRRFGIEEKPTPLLLLGLYQLHGESFLEDLSVIFEGKDDLVSFSGIYGNLADSATTAQSAATAKQQADKQAKTKSTIQSVASFVKLGVDALKTSKSSGNTAGNPPPPEEESADKTKKVIIIGAIVIVVLIVVVIVIKKFKK